ncbi:hypothetical protein [Marinimicrobium sp. ABcell2]|uniref:hypothetical protein n=1 Tax=Marinimicrobium sp. ABcell2 TaxID=3069751 RepID=UPI0027B23958|nr:hypothetical protein [Marinimicrobium sp. ABcell2]MDQ2077566.1 hypothetical protein [Marinimicrobium sp. ABcell2]
MKSSKAGLRSIYLGIITLGVLLIVVKFADDHYGKIAIERDPGLYIDSPALIADKHTAFVERLAETDDYCSLLEEDDFKGLGLAHRLCIDDALVKGDILQVRSHFRSAFATISPIELGLFFDLNVEAIDESKVAGLEDELQCLRSLNDQATQAVEFPMSGYLPGITAYRLSVNPGVRFGEECDVVDRLSGHDAHHRARAFTARHSSESEAGY